MTTGLKAIVAEDDDRVRTLACRMLTQLGIEAEGVSDGLEALMRIQGGGYQLLVTDLDMPRLNGQSLVAALRSDGNPIPIVVISAVGDGQDIVELFNHSVGEYIRKPFRRKEFLASVRRVIGAPAEDDAEPPAEAAPPAAAEAAPSPEAPRIPPPARPAAPPPVAPLRPVPDPTAPEPARLQVVPQAPPQRPVAAEPVEEAVPLTVAEVLKRLNDALARGTFELPVPLPSVARLVQMRRDPDLSSQAVVNVLSASPNLAAAAVQTANTAFYNRGSKVSNLAQAAIRLGNRTLINLALTVLHQRFYRVRNAELQRIVDSTWASTVLAANLTRPLAREVYGVDPDDAYLAALFHNVGEMVILRVVDEEVGNIELTQRDLALLRAQCYEQHGAVGARLLHQWEFAPLNVQVARAHHTGATPTGFPDLTPAERRLTQLLNVALHLAQELGPPAPVTRPPDLHLGQSLALLSLTEDRARIIAEEVAGADNRRGS